MKQYKWRVTISPSFVSLYVYFSLNSPLPSLRPAIVSAATCTLSSPVSLHSSEAPIICITWQIQRAWRCFCVWACAPFVCGTAAAPARVQAGPCVRACVHLCTLSFSFFLFLSMMEWECWRHLMVPRLWLRFYLMLRWQLLTKGIHTCVYNLSYGSKQTRHSGHLLSVQFDMTQTECACAGFWAAGF